MTMQEISVSPNASVFHERFGQGSVLAAMPQTVVVRFTHGIEECSPEELRSVSSVYAMLNSTEWNVPLEVITRFQAEAIRSTNDAWGVFTRSRIQLLPHQLWVCRKVLAKLPTRWIVADDVGLGKTVEAGLILLPLVSRGDARRVLVLCPASLVEQWQLRMRDMFGIHLTPYMTELDKPDNDFWGSYPQVVASLHTLRLDRNERQKRIIESEPWDIVIVDEAHHLNADEKGGATLGYAFLEKMLAAQKIRSMVFFTGTPHRGKDFGFLSLLKLLRGDLFDTEKSLHEQLPQIAEVMIRNNKQNVTDLSGNRLFQKPANRPMEYAYSPEEADFYGMLTNFIADGKLYASGLSANNGRAVMLVLFAMQKLASSSVAAISKALRNRIDKKQRIKKEIAQLEAKLELYKQLETEDEFDEINRIDEEILELSAGLRLSDNEEHYLRILLEKADKIHTESKVTEILSLLENEFSGRSVLLFTEYKATQALVMSALISQYGDDSVVFINGDSRVDDVVLKNGTKTSRRMTRKDAVAKFNKGQARFLIATEAGGEGIDLQERCHSMIHIDLPWNPMRLHQRVGRLNRYGQTEQVEVVTIRNPDTVESHIWNILNEKIERIMRAVGQAMDEPEDLLQLVLGMTTPDFFREIFMEGSSIERERLPDWFDSRSATFGGRNVIDTVKELIGHCSKFDFPQISDQIPRVDLIDLKAFFIGAIENNRRKVHDEESGLKFITPDEWHKGDVAIQKEYKELLFDRRYKGEKAIQRVLGVGHRLFDKAMELAMRQTASVTIVPEKILNNALFVFKVNDRVTTMGSRASVLFGVEKRSDGEWNTLSDWKLLLLLNELSTDRGLWKRRIPLVDIDGRIVAHDAEQALLRLREFLNDFHLDFKVPETVLTGILWPGTAVSEKEIPESAEQTS